MKRDADHSFKSNGGGRQVVKVLLEGNAKRSKPLQVHIVEHSASAILLAHLLDSIDAMNPANTPIKSCSFMAPASSVDLFEKSYLHHIGKSNAASGVAKLWQYNLIDQR